MTILEGGKINDTCACISDPPTPTLPSPPQSTRLLEPEGNTDDILEVKKSLRVTDLGKENKINHPSTQIPPTQRLNSPKNKGHNVQPHTPSPDHSTTLNVTKVLNFNGNCKVSLI
jgi:hypothetical protein